MLVTSNDIEKVNVEEIGVTNNGNIIDNQDNIVNHNTTSDNSNDIDITMDKESEENHDDNKKFIQTDGSISPGTIFPGMFGSVFSGLGGLNIHQTDENGNPIPKNNHESPDYIQLFETYGKLFDHQDKNIDYLNGAINNLISQLNEYKRNQSLKLRIMFILIVVSWIIMIIKL